ncbi:MAG: hypothetical protein KC427_05965 [Sulfurovum sp.]|uniref:DUF234 domain-containing protein n=1 Tax=Sulfurovum sp. TaxID=1969726 RepID=UPI002867DA19|nr:DUF234 domain-containing protein [Sulfurovum sp.]MCO4845548.1 hypothetical protein [Sulfurovum sp.]
MELEQAVEYFSILGGIGKNIELDYFDDIFSMVEFNFVQNFSKFQTLVSPSYLLESPYREILIAVARGDGKLYSVLRKAKVSEALGEKIVQELVDLNVLKVEASRESPLRIHPKHKLKKEQRSYRVQNKLRFVQPFMRFWFGFVTYYKKDLAVGKGDAFLENFEKHYDRLRSLVYEQLCDALLVQHYEERSPLVSGGSFWNIHSEFDILAVSKDKKVILGECKYKDRKVCKNELTKLKAKALESGINVDVYALFSKSGFSNELLQTEDKDLLLFNLNDLKQLL